MGTVVDPPPQTVQRVDGQIDRLIGKTTRQHRIKEMGIKTEHPNSGITETTNARKGIGIRMTVKVNSTTESELKWLAAS